MGDIGGELLIILILTLANGFFSGSEIAIVSARKSRLQAKATAGSRGARQALKLQDSPDRFLATVQVGITLIGTFSAAFGGARVAEVLAEAIRPNVGEAADTLALALVVAMLTYLSLVLGELVPKRIALRGAEGWATFAAPIMSLLSLVARPLVAFLTVSVNLVARLLGQTDAQDEGVTEEDILFMTREGQQSGAVEGREAQLIQSVFRLTDRPVRSVMTPRTELVAVPITTPLSEVVGLLLKTQYSRLPVYEGAIDRVVGILHAKDVLRGVTDPETAGLDTVVQVRRLMRQPTVIPESAHIDEVLSTFRRRGVHMAVVIDEYGQTAGVVTMEDLLEELVGEIKDEYDKAERSSIITRPDGSWLVDGREAIDKVAARVGMPMPDPEDLSDFTTLAGFIMARLDRIPEEGDTFTEGAFSVEVVDMDGRRIDKVLIRRVDDGASDDTRKE
ncbi:MAG: hemolysin family protein [Anaerolineae bacterium]|nr:hemolysin family protein [Anaerolineae bacterium]